MHNPASRRVAHMTTIRMTVTPAAGLVDEPLRIRVRGMPPVSKVTIRAQLHDERGVLWSSDARYRADTKGSIDVDGERLIASLSTSSELPSRTFDNSNLT